MSSGAWIKHLAILITKGTHAMACPCILDLNANDLFNTPTHRLLSANNCQPLRARG